MQVRSHALHHATLVGTQFVFGYWHINDKDEIIIPVPGVNGDADHIIIINKGLIEQGAWWVPYATATSLHPGGANFLFADGSVKFLKESINIQTYRSLGTRAWNEVISADAL